MGLPRRGGFYCLFGLNFSKHLTASNGLLEAGLELWSGRDDC